jgi:hypothetical protein
MDSPIPDPTLGAWALLSLMLLMLVMVMPVPDCFLARIPEQARADG